MELTHHFTVPASIDAAWAAFNDLEQIAPCFPGAALTSFDGERFEGLCKVKLGPISLQYTGTGRFVERDESAKRAVIEAKGKDKRGNGTAAAAVTAQLIAASANTTDVEVRTDLNVTGRPAQFGRGVMQDVSDRLLAQFTACLETRLGGGDGAAASLPTVVAPSAAEVASALGDDDDRGTPIAAEAQQAAQSSPPQRACVSRPAEQPQAVALDLGATVLPALLKRYAAPIGAALVVLWVLRKVLSRA